MTVTEKKDHVKRITACRRGKLTALAGRNRLRCEFMVEADADDAVKHLSYLELKRIQCFARMVYVWL